MEENFQREILLLKKNEQEAIAPASQLEEELEGA